MRIIHARQWLDGNERFRVDCDTQANVLLMDDNSFRAYKRGGPYRYSDGGFFKRYPAILTPPYPGHWNVTIDLAGARAHIRYSITVVSVPTARPIEPPIEGPPAGWEPPPADEGEPPAECPPPPGPI
jgi:hypothetical protein